MSNTTHQLRVYASVFSSEPAEVRDIPQGVILGQWLTANVSGFDAENTELQFSLPFCQPVNCDIDCYLVPKKGAVKAVTKIFKKIIGFLLGNKKPNMPKMNTQAQGTELDMATANNQTAKYGQPIREAFGKNKIIPDYLVPPRRYFASKKEHWMETLLCVGVGDYQANNGDVKISNSNLNDIGQGNRANVYAPNANLEGEACAQWWHTSKEVGPTSQGSSGLKLETADGGQRLAEGGNYLFSGKTISAQSGQSWPTSWTVGTLLNVGIKQQYRYIENKVGPYITTGILSGNFSGLELGNGDTVDIRGDVTGRYQVLKYTPPVVGNQGSASIWQAGGTPELDYSVSQSQFIVSCGNASASITLDDTYSSQSALVSALNDKLSVSPLSGLCEFSAGLKITELPNFSARTISVQNISNASMVFGDLSAAEFSRGAPRTESLPAELTLLKFAARDITNLIITKANTQYEITNVSSGSINVELVDGGGNLVPWGGWEDDVLSNNPLIARSPNSIQTLWRGPFAATPSNELCTHLEYDIFFPQGLNRRNDDGNPTPRSCGSVLRYRESASNDWVEVVNRYTEKEIDQIGFTHVVALPRPMRIAEVQVRRESAESTDSKDSEAMEWFGLRAKMARQVTRYPQLTTLAVRVNGSTVAAQSDSEINLVATRKLNGSPTRSIADAVRYIARNADLNEGEINRLNTIWQGRNDYFDFQFNSFATVGAAVKRALSVGFADLTIKDGLLSPVRDAARPPELLHAYNHTYSAQNTTDNIVVSIDMPDPDEIDGYDVEYIDERTWRVETVRCQLPGSAGLRIAKITADGITNRNRAYRWGMRQLMTELLDNKTLSTKTELDALNSQFGDYVNFVQEVEGWSQSSLVESVNGLVMRSTEPLDWQDGAEHVVALRREDGTMSAVKDAVRIDDYQIGIGSAFSFAIKPHETHLFFGTKQRFANPSIVRDIRPSGDSATISATAYNANKYQYDDAEAPQ